jgi:hypothetical protein
VTGPWACALQATWALDLWGQQTLAGLGSMSCCQETEAVQYCSCQGAAHVHPHPIPRQHRFVSSFTVCLLAWLEYVSVRCCLHGAHKMPACMVSLHTRPSLAAAISCQVVVAHAVQSRLGYCPALCATCAQAPCVGRPHGFHASLCPHGDGHCCRLLHLFAATAMFVSSTYRWQYVWFGTMSHHPHLKGAACAG